jgi:hypothetical protein
VVYVLFARAGFTSAVEARTREEGVLLVGPTHLLAPGGTAQ